MKMNNWERIARTLTNKTYVDLDLRMFQCPHCNNLIYEEEWRETQYFKGNYKKHFYCPICRAELMRDINS